MGEGFVHQNRGAEPKCLYTVGNLADLPIRVDPRIAWVGLDVLNRKDAFYAPYCNHASPKTGADAMAIDQFRYAKKWNNSRA